MTSGYKTAYNRDVRKKDVIAHFGTVAALADALDISPEAIYQWGARVPASREFQIQVLTKGKLEARPPLLKKTAARAQT